MKEISLVPKRRFKEFQTNHIWEERRFFDNIKNTIDFRGRTPKKLGLDWSENGYLALSALNVKNGYIDYSVDSHYGNQELYDRWMTGYELRKGQVLFTTEAPMGNVAQVPDDRGYILSQRTIAFNVIPEKITDDFLAVLLRSPKTYAKLSALSSGGTAKGVSQKSMAQLNVVVPISIKEQTKIGNFFKKLDQLIFLHQRKLKKIDSLKSAYLSEMFPAEGEYVPKIRFAGFTQPWEMAKLSDTTDVYDGTHQTPDYKNEGIMFLSVEDIKTLKSEKYISKEAFAKEFKVSPEKGDVLITRIGDIGTANVVESDEPIGYYVSLALLKKKKLNPYFLQANIHSPTMQKEFYKRTLHIAFPKKINKNEIADVPILFPCDEEQIKIGNFFINIDYLITYHQRKLDKLQNLKKAYLNEMFV